jgi:HEAT repeat protein
MKWFTIIFLATFLIGCGRGAPPLSGGKPVSYWIEALQERDAKLRKKAVTKLGNAGPIDPEVYPALIEALKDADAQVRCEAILSLLKFGPGAKDAIPILEEMQKNDRDSQVRSYAEKAVEKLRSFP